MNIEKIKKEAASKAINKFVQELEARFCRLKIQAGRRGSPSQRRESIISKLDKKVSKLEKKNRKLREQ